MVIAQNINVLNQLTQVISQLSNEKYAEPLSIFEGSSIGQHCRHIVEFYQCFFDGVMQNQINYDARKRDYEIETNLDKTIQKIDGIVGQLYETSDLEGSISLDVSTSSNALEIIESNAHRELFYLLEHTVHHLALIKIGLISNFNEIEIPKYFGIAASTIQYRESTNA